MAKSRAISPMCQYDAPFNCRCAGSIQYQEGFGAGGRHCRKGVPKRHCHRLDAIIRQGPMARTTSSKDTGNPCIGSCRFDTNGACRGCRRTKAEVKGWKRLPDEAKAAINGRIRAERIAAKPPRKRLRKLGKKIRKLETKLEALRAEREALESARPAE
ncbi:DUF1289 domain-containing protein [Azospirillum thiophilum]|uniref:DUF1289 domain-containing protein n=2 Tax=Azospirillum thiophilum TaxID=528244 RepID=UPI00316AD464